MPTLEYAVLDSPIDPLLAVAGPEGLLALEFDAARRLKTVRARLARHLGDVELRPAPLRGGPLAPVREWFARYWDGSALEGATLPHVLLGTAFQVAVWRALLEVPAGTTRTYGQLAHRVGRPEAARAVGAAVGQNPVAIVVPCHRIIGANGSLTGFGGGLPRKKWLLAHEADHAQAPDSRRARGRQLALWGA